MKTAMSSAVTNYQFPVMAPPPSSAFAGVSDERYTARLAENPYEVASALRLRHEVFNVELGNGQDADGSSNLEFDAYDFRSRHMIVIDQRSGSTVGTYRLNTIESARTARGFYSHSEFTIEDLPRAVLQNGIEIGRACVAPAHRNTKVLFLLLKGLLHYQRKMRKRYFFGCCSIFSQDALVGKQAHRQLVEGDFLHNALQVQPRKEVTNIDYGKFIPGKVVELPGLFKLYLRTGAKACGPPTIDREFGTIDFFVIFDVTTMSAKYRKMFFA